MSVVAPDGASTTTYLYSGNTVTLTGAAGKWKTMALARAVDQTGRFRICQGRTKCHRTIHPDRVQRQCADIKRERFFAGFPWENLKESSIGRDLLDDKRRLATVIPRRRTSVVSMFIRARGRYIGSTVLSQFETLAHWH